jgi:hypothetical protein
MSAASLVEVGLRWCVTDIDTAEMDIEQLLLAIMQEDFHRALLQEQLPR